MENPHSNKRPIGDNRQFSDLSVRQNQYAYKRWWLSMVSRYNWYNGSTKTFPTANVFKQFGAQRPGLRKNRVAGVAAPKGSGNASIRPIPDSSPLLENEPDARVRKLAPLISGQSDTVNRDSRTTPRGRPAWTSMRRIIPFLAPSSRAMSRRKSSRSTKSASANSRRGPSSR